MKHFLTCLSAVSCMTLLLCAGTSPTTYTEAINGINWSYTDNGDRTISGGWSTATLGGIFYPAGTYSGDYYVTISRDTQGAITIPSKFNRSDCYSMTGYSPCRVTAIGTSGFQLCTKITNVTIPSLVSSIGRLAFNGCSNLTSISIVQGGTNLQVGEAAFSNCQRLENVLLPDYTDSIGARAFENCRSITSFMFPSNLQSIGAYVFAGCSSLEKINTGESKFRFYGNLVYQQDMSTFVSCLKDSTIIDFSPQTSYVMPYSCQHSELLEELNLEGTTVTNIGQCAFLDCSSLTNVVLPECLTTIGMISFKGCSSLSTVTIRHNVSSIGNWAFSGCTNITEVIVDEGDTDRVLTMLRNTGSSNVVWDKCTLVEIPRVKSPVVVNNESSFNTISKTVELCSATEDAEIYYTVDGTEPSAANGRKYKGAFDIYQTLTIKAVACRNEYRDSEIMTFTFTKENVLSEALNCLNMAPETQSELGWTVDTTVSHDGVSSMKSGAIENDGMTYMQVSVKGTGRLSFWWKAQCEEPTPEDGKDGYYDYCAFMTGGADVKYLAGEDTGWQQFVTNITTGGKHVLRWEYRKDSEGSFKPDCVWVDQVQWLSANAADETDHTLTTETPVPYTWLDKYGLGRESDFESAAKALSGKFDGTGHATTVEEEYITGTDPTNTTSQLKALVDMSNGFPKVTWDPDLNEDGTKAIRTYKVWGKVTLDDTSDWEYPTNSLHHFFKVTVEMP